MPTAQVLIEPACENADLPGGDSDSGRARPLSAAARFLRIIQTVRHHRAGQLVRRAVSVAGRRIRARQRVERFALPAGERLGIECSGSLALIAGRRLQHRRNDSRTEQHAAAVRSGRWTFLGRTIELGLPLDWQSPELRQAPRLWQFQLQYHEWLLDLAAAAADADAPQGCAGVWDHVLHWIDLLGAGMEPALSDAWHPYCISRRIPAWLSLWAWQAPPAEHRQTILRSLAAQVSCLTRRLERELGGNHLLENARALVVAGSALQTTRAAEWLDLGKSTFDAEAKEQLLPHGEHFERSPMYHCLMIEAFEDARDATQSIDRDFSMRCGTTVARMQEFVDAILHPDGDIPLLGDSCFDEARSVKQASAAPDGARQIGDYWTYRRGGDFLLFDAGPVGADHLPAHAHADLLSIEASFEGRRFIVDSGVHDYEDGAMRQYCRSTAAHNTLEVDGENQCDVYSRFRMGRRGWPASFLCGQENDIAWASATHNAYRRLDVSSIGRWVGCTEKGDWLIADWAVGGGSMHSLVNRLHLHPEVEVVEHSRQLLALYRNGVRRWLTPLGRGQVQVVRGWHCSRFGERSPSSVVEMRLRTAMPAVVGWRIAKEPPNVVAELVVEGGSLSVSNWEPAGGHRQLIRIQ